MNNRLNKWCAGWMLSGVWQDVCKTEMIIKRGCLYIFSFSNNKYSFNFSPKTLSVNSLERRHTNIHKAVPHEQWNTPSHVTAVTSAYIQNTVQSCRKTIFNVSIYFMHKNTMALNFQMFLSVSCLVIQTPRLNIQRCYRKEDKCMCIEIYSNSIFSTFHLR